MLARRRPVVGATVVISTAGEPRRLYMTATDDRGDFRLEGMPEGIYRVEIRRSDLKPVAKDNVALRAPFRAIVELTMEPLSGAPAPVGATGGSPGATAPGTVGAVASSGSSPGGAPVRISGRVVDREGRPLEDVRLRWVLAGGSGADPRSLTSDPVGRFGLDALSAGLWRVEVAGTGFLPLRAELALDRDTELTAVLVPQSAGYEPQPFDLMPREEPIPPPASGESAGSPSPR